MLNPVWRIESLQRIMLVCAPFAIFPALFYFKAAHAIGATAGCKAACEALNGRYATGGAIVVDVGFTVSGVI